MSLSSLPDSRVLSSWKEIATHLAVGVRTAQLWEAERGLPVQRLPGPRGRVYATVAALDTWRESRPGIPVPVEAASSATVSWARYGIAAVVFLSAIGLFAVAVRRPALSSVSVLPDGLLGLDSQGAVLWRHPFGILNVPAYAVEDRRSWVGDLGDGRTSVLFVPIPAGVVQESVPLVCLDREGRERWRFEPGKTVQHDKRVFRPPFLVRQFAVMGTLIVVTSHHHLYAPSQVAVLDNQGRLLREYWHLGHLNALAMGLYEGRPVAFLGGLNNRRHAATLVALDPERLTGAGLEHDEPAFVGMARPVEAARILFPRSILNEDEPYNSVVRLLAQRDQLIVDVHERLVASNPPSIIYHLNPRLDVAEVALSDGFRRDYLQKTKHPITPADEAALHQLKRLR